MNLFSKFRPNKLFHGSVLAIALLHTAPTDLRAADDSGAIRALNGPTVTKSEQFQPGTVWNLWCAKNTYRYEIDNPANCVLPVDRFCITFATGLQHLDLGSIRAPHGWSFTVDHQNNRICFNAWIRTKQVQPGQSLDGFEVTTKCNPQAIEGRQPYDLAAPGGQIPLHQGLCSFDAHHLYGDPLASVGGFAEILVTSAENPFGTSVLFIGLEAPQGFPTVFGELELDPLTLIEVGAMPLDPLGLGMMHLPIPPEPNLSGFDLPMQAITLGTSRLPQLSNLKVLPLR